MSIYYYSISDAQGVEKPLAAYKGKPMLIVNTASMCGYTPQYAGLQKLYQTWHAKGLEILAFPCDQFGHQEPGKDEEIQLFCKEKYDVTFPVFAKVDVNGACAHPLYQFLTKTTGSWPASDIHWNFTKFLVDGEGNVVARFEPAMTPEQIEPEIARLLG